MSFSFFESFIAEDKEVEIVSKGLYESLAMDPLRDVIVESAESVLGQLYAKLRNGGNFNDQEAADYAETMTGLSILTVDDNRQAFNVDISQEGGRQKMMNVMDNVGEHQGITAQVRRIATDNATGEYKRNLRQLQSFRQMSPMEQQQVLVSVNKLRLAYGRLKAQLQSGAFSSPEKMAA